ncbi:MAG TPA: hypothetical protein VK974_01275 [Methylophilaceae bacterium]|nr:hypothetical protein [Methylophilaceae bacterium]
MQNQFLIKIDNQFIGSNDTGWLMLVSKDEAEIFNSEQEAMMVARNFSREPCWDIELITI